MSFNPATFNLEAHGKDIDFEVVGPGYSELNTLVRVTVWEDNGNGTRTGRTASISLYDLTRLVQSARELTNR